MSRKPEPVDRTAIVLTLFAFGTINLSVVLYFGDLISQRFATALLVLGLAFAIPAWIRIRRK